MRCKGKKANGEPCQAWALHQSDYCFSHDPGRTAERTAARKLGGYATRSKHGGDSGSLPAKVRSLEDVLSLLDYTLAELAAQDNSLARSRALIALAGEYRQAIVTGEFEVRISTLEERINAKP
jgi:hypothetical protein